MKLPPLIGLTGKAGHGKDSFYALVLAPRGYQRVALADAVKGLALVASVVENEMPYLQARAIEALAPLEAHVLALTSKMVEFDPKKYAEVYGKFRHAFAESLVPSDKRVLGATLDRYYQYFGAKKSPRVRAELQFLGTEVGRAIDPGLWVQLALTEVKGLLESGQRVCVTDVRFPNEGWAVRGDVEQMRAAYEAGPFLPATKQALTRDWSSGGLLPPAGLGAVIRVVREGYEGLPEDLANHPSETSVTQVAADYEVRASSLADLMAAGDDLAGPILDYYP